MPWPVPCHRCHLARRRSGALRRCHSTDFLAPVQRQRPLARWTWLFRPLQGVPARNTGIRGKPWPTFPGQTRPCFGPWLLHLHCCDHSPTCVGSYLWLGWLIGWLSMVGRLVLTTPVVFFVLVDHKLTPFTAPNVTTQAALPGGLSRAMVCTCNQQG